MVFLSGRVSLKRIEHEKYIGSSTGKGSDETDPLLIATRCHQNFLENIPMAFLLASIVELNGGNRKVLNSLLAALFVLRISHAEFGLLGKDAMGPGRALGHTGTSAFLVGMAGYAAYLVKGYWGY